MKGDEDPFSMSALQISPRFTSLDWGALDANVPEDWRRATTIVEDRLDGRFLSFATRSLASQYSGFVVLAIDCLLAETIQQFKDGVVEGHGQSTKMITRFLENPRFQPDFDQSARMAFYDDIRCGLLHQAEAKKMWLVRRKQKVLLQPAPGGGGYILDVERFHDAMVGSLNDYLAMVLEPPSTLLRTNLWKKMNHICLTRTLRGAVYETGAS